MIQREPWSQTAKRTEFGSYESGRRLPAVPQLLATSDMIGVFTQLAANAFTSSYKLVKRPVPINVGPISTYMVWQARNDRDARQNWLRQQIRAGYERLKPGRPAARG